MKTEHCVLSSFRRNRLARATSLILAGIFSLRAVEVEADSGVADSAGDSLSEPSEAGALLERDYVEIALTAAHAAPAVFASRALLGAPPPINVLVTGATGIAASGVNSGATVRLGAASTTGVRAEAGTSVGFDGSRVESSATTAALANRQIGLHARDGGQIEATGSSVVLDPRTGAGTVLTVSDMTGVRAESGGKVLLDGTSVVMGGGAKGNNNAGVVATGAGSSVEMRGGSVSTSSLGSVGVSVADGAGVQLGDGTTVSTTGARSTTTGGSHGISVSGTGSRLDADGVQVTTSSASAYGLRVDKGASAQLADSAVGTAGANGHGVLADGAEVELSGVDIGTTGKGAVGTWARNGAAVTIQGGSVQTSGAGLSSAAPVNDEKSLSLSHGLLATGQGTRIDASGAAILTSAASASAARAEEGARIDLAASRIEASGAASNTATTAALHALGGGKIGVSDSTISSTATNVGGVRAEGAGSQVHLSGSEVQVTGAGNVVNPASAARAMGGGELLIENASLVGTGTYSHGVSVEGAGSHASVSGSDIRVEGPRSMGVHVKDGATAEVAGSNILATTAGPVGPWAPGVQVEGVGSGLSLRDSAVRTTQGSSLGVRVIDGAQATLDRGSVTTEGNYSSGIAAANSRVTVNQVEVTTHGNDNAMGIVADTGATVTVNGGSVLTTGSGSPVSNNLTFPHGLAARNAGALLIANGTTVVTQGSQAYGAAVDDGGSMILDNLSVRTEGQYANGLYAGIGSAKPGNVSLQASNVTVETLGDNASGAVVSRQYKDETATMTLDNVSLSTRGVQSHGLRAESGAELTARETSVSTSGLGALGAMANNKASVDLERVVVSTSGAVGHGAVAKNGGVLHADNALIHASGDQAAALYVQGTDALPGKAELSRANLGNRDGATIATAGVADISLSQSVVGGSGQWLNVDRSVASAGTTLPDLGTGQWQGVGQSFDSAGRATIDLGGSIVTGSATTASGSTAALTMHDTSIWRLTGDSNLTSLVNDASLIDFSAPIAGQHKTLTVHDYKGVNGTVALNTFLGSDGSPSDKIAVDGGRASGETSLQIRNAGGLGALTTGNGIQVVDARNGGTTDAQAFRLLNRVVAGPYEYSLHRSSLDDSNGEAWYLRSSASGQAPAEPGFVPAPTPNYRAETSLYSAMPAMALHYSHAMVDTLHERVGEERRLATDPLPAEEVDTYGPSLGWGRIIYRKGSDSLASGADYDYRVQAFQVGSDLYRNDDIDGSTDQAGLSLQIGRIGGNVEHTDGTSAGDDQLRSYGIGGYWTHFGPEGWYLDGVLQFNRFDIKARPNGLDSMKTRGHGVTASLEAGYPFKVNRDKTLQVEPQAQLIATRLSIKDAHDDAADVRFEDVDSLTGRLGVRIDKDWFREDDNGKIHRTNGWIRPSVWHEFKGKAKTEFSSADGYIPFGTDMSGTWGEMNLGVDYQVNDRTTVTGSLGYQQALDGDGRSYEGIIGIKVKF